MARSLPVGHVPQLDRLVPAPRGQGLAVGAEGHGADVFGVHTERDDALGRGHVPNLHIPLPAPSPEAMVLPSELNATDRNLAPFSWIVVVFRPETTSQSRLNKLGTGSDIYNYIIERLHIAQLVRRTIILAIFPPSAGPAIARPDELGSPSSSEQQRLVRAIFKRMKTWCDVHGAKLVVINNGWRTYDWLAALLSSENITFFDPTPQIQPIITRDLAAYTIVGDGHPNAKGAMLVADAVWPFIQTFIKDQR